MEGEAIPVGSDDPMASARKLCRGRQNACLELYVSGDAR